MLTLGLGGLVGLLVGLVAHFSLDSVGWAVFGFVLGFFSTTISINLWMRKKLEAIFLDVQKQVEEGQGQLRRKINMLQAKNAGGGKGFLRRMEKEQAVGIREAIAGLDRVKPMQKWNFLAEKQANTLRAQLYFQIREYEKADECFDRCLIMDPLTLAMKMTRLHAKGNQAEIEKLFKKGVKQYKDEKGVILYALYSWILVQTNRIDDALALLSQAKDKTEDATLRTNWEHLANGRARHFSNAGLGDQWYALHLEEPKAVKTRGHIAGRWMR